MPGNARGGRCGCDLQPVREAAARLSSVVAAFSIFSAPPRCSCDAGMAVLRHPRRPLLRRTPARYSLPDVPPSRQRSRFRTSWPQRRFSKDPATEGPTAGFARRLGPRRSGVLPLLVLRTSSSHRFALLLGAGASKPQRAGSSNALSVDCHPSHCAFGLRPHNMKNGTSRPRHLLVLPAPLSTQMVGAVLLFFRASARTKLARRGV